MKYRKFSNKIDFQPSALGFGLMRLPLTPDGKVDYAESIRIVRHAIDNGVNYLDTAYVYHGGESEKIMAEILKDGYREKVKIADKFPLWELKEDPADLDRIFFEQLERLQVKKIDFYLLHSLSKWSFFHYEKKFQLIKWLEKKRADGYIDYIGFSFHDKLPAFKAIVDYYSWDFYLLQINIIDTKSQAGVAGMKYAHKKDIGIIVMEALRGGQLTGSIPKEIQSLWKHFADHCEILE